MKTHTWLSLMILIGVPCASAHAADFSSAGSMTDAQLDRIRGGFDLGGDLRASFALQRTVFINGMQSVQTSISVPDIANITRDQATALQAALRTTVVTNGAGGVTSDAISPTTSLAASAAAVGSAPSAGLIIQNSLDNQAIAATTTINASVNTGRLLESMRVAESIKDAVIQFRGN